MLNGRPLLAWRITPSWLLFRSAGAEPGAADRGREDGGQREGVRLVERRDAAVAFEIGRVGHAVVTAADDEGAGQRRGVDAAGQRVGRLRLPAVGHPLGQRRGEGVVGRLADRLEHVDVIERRVDAGRRR